MSVGCEDFWQDRQCDSGDIDGVECVWNLRFDNCCCTPQDNMDLIIIFLINQALNQNQLESFRYFFCEATYNIDNGNSQTNIAFIIYNTNATVLIEFNDKSSTFNNNTWICENWFPNNVSNYILLTNLYQTTYQVYDALMHANSMFETSYNPNNPKAVWLLTNDKWTGIAKDIDTRCDLFESMITDNNVTLFGISEKRNDGGYNGYSCLIDKNICNPQLFLNITGFNNNRLNGLYQDLMERIYPLDFSNDN